MSKPYIEASQLGKIYLRGAEPVEALVSATCSIMPGARIALIGPSGSGKSTLLQLLAGLDQPSSGTISWPCWGDSQALLPEKIGFVFQIQSLLPPLTVIENVALPLLLIHREPDEANSKAREIIRKLELSSLEDKLPEELSGGQAQRVAVARALVTRPQLILADEPTGQLDHPTAEHLFDVLLEFLESSDTALLVATHDKTVSRRMDTEWRMKRGVLEV